MNLINSQQNQTNVLPGYLSEISSEQKLASDQFKSKNGSTLYDLGEVPSHALDENDGIPLSSKESKFVWLAIVVGQIILGLTIYAIF